MGKPRSPIVVVLLSIVTFGIYGVVWAWKAFREVDDASGQKHRAGWFVAALVIFLAALVFQLPLLLAEAAGGSLLAVVAVALLMSAPQLGYVVPEVRQVIKARASLGGSANMLLAWAFVVLTVGSAVLSGVFMDLDMLTATATDLVPAMISYLAFLVASLTWLVLVQLAINDFWARRSGGGQQTIIVNVHDGVNA